MSLQPDHRYAELCLTGRGLACVRGGRRVFHGVSFSVEGGHALALRGPNGVGKSSLLRLIAGLVRMDAGTLELAGGAPDVPLGEQAHYLGHLDALKPSLSVIENLGFWATFLSGREAAREDLEAALDAVGIGDLASLPARYLSAGQRRRLALARLAAVRRPVWMLDEPTSALDADGQRLLFALVGAHLSCGGIVVVATHVDLPFATTVLALEAMR
ncbi:MAG: heme ABC exporter ATP-binding protein CcmA [Rhodobiaceae bacterium]|nr:heme ABC exporter ATP-binding protein CcmA [Rhodobiaceae bacterium]MCC0041275.1 heme ABC exporter ATP-binding protein CcmA [Rhodobiaceae bacterium]